MCGAAQSEGKLRGGREIVKLPPLLRGSPPSGQIQLAVLASSPCPLTVPSCVAGAGRWSGRFSSLVVSRVFVFYGLLFCHSVSRRFVAAVVLGSFRWAFVSCGRRALWRLSFVFGFFPWGWAVVGGGAVSVVVGAVGLFGCCLGVAGFCPVACCARWGFFSSPLVRRFCLAVLVCAAGFARRLFLCAEKSAKRKQSDNKNRLFAPQ